MCLPNYIETKQIEEFNSIIGYRNWRVLIKSPDNLISQFQNYNWSVVEGPHKLTESNSGIYVYNYNNYNNYYYSYIAGIIKQYGEVKIHETGQRSEYARVKTLFTIRELDAKGPKEFLDWIKKFNSIIKALAKKYECETQHYQDFTESSQK